MKYLFILGSIVAIIILLSLITSANTGIGSHRISTRIVNNVPEFYDVSTNNEFIPRGNNFVRIGGNFTEPEYSPILFYPNYNFSERLNTMVFLDTFGSDYNAGTIYSNLTKMSDEGYNVARIFFENFPHTSQTVGAGERLNQTYIDNLINFTKIARDKDMYVILAFGYLPVTYYGIVNLSCVNNEPRYSWTNITISGNRYMVCALGNSSGSNALYMHNGIINATRIYIVDVLNNISQSDPTLINTILDVELFNEPDFEPTKQPFNMTGNLTFNLLGEDINYNMTTNASRQALADNATLHWIQQVAGYVNQSYQNLSITSGLYTPYLSGRPGYNGVSNKSTLDPDSAFNVSYPQRVRVYADSPLIDLIDIHLYLTPTGDPQDTIYNITKDMRSAELNKTGSNTTIFSFDGAPLNKPLMMGELAADRGFYTAIQSAVNNVTIHQMKSCSFGFTGWSTWRWDNDTANWNAIDNDFAIAINQSPYYRPNPCSVQHMQFRNCGPIENNDPRPFACDSYVNDFVQCSNDNKCVYDGICYTQDQTYYASGYGTLVCKSGKWCPEGFSWDAGNNRCYFPHDWGDNKIYLKNSSGSNVARLDNFGNIVLKGNLTQNSAQGLTNDDEWVYVNKSGTPLVIINMVNGNMFIRRGLLYNQLSITNNPNSDDFIVADTGNNIQILMNQTGSVLIKGYLFENSNP